jgi:hypothetical protein
MNVYNGALLKSPSLEKILNRQTIILTGKTTENFVKLIKEIRKENGY